MALLKLLHPLRQPRPDEIAPADSMTFLVIQFCKQNIGQGLACGRGIDEEGCAVDVGEPFMQCFVKKCQACG